MQLLYLLILPVSLIFGAAATAQEGVTAPGKPEPLQIEADRMESYDNKNEVIFLGRVEATQGGLVIQAEEMRVFYLPAREEAGGALGSQRLDKVFARGEVRVTQEELVATGHTLDYFAEERKVILTGNARVSQDNNLITGNQVTLYLDEGKTVVERSAQEGERVRAFIYPEAEEQPGQ
jgi:lipopolysaccharide export system protein LptA